MKDTRDKDSVPVLTVTCIEEGAMEKLARLLENRTLLHHLNRAIVNFELPEGRTLTFVVWPHNDDHEDYTRRVNQLNWSEH